MLLPLRRLRRVCVSVIAVSHLAAVLTGGASFLHVRVSFRASPYYSPSFRLFLSLSPLAACGCVVAESVGRYHCAALTATLRVASRTAFPPQGLSAPHPHPSGRNARCWQRVGAVMLITLIASVAPIPLPAANLVAGHTLANRQSIWLVR